eukprot:6064209-Alexandrium_andersonii.AAC.1
MRTVPALSGRPRARACRIGPPVGEGRGPGWEQDVEHELVGSTLFLRRPRHLLLKALVAVS